MKIALLVDNVLKMSERCKNVGCSLSQRFVELEVKIVVPPEAILFYAQFLRQM